MSLIPSSTQWLANLSGAKEATTSALQQTMHRKGFKHELLVDQNKNELLQSSSWNHFLISQCTSKRQWRASLAKGNANERPSLSNVAWLYFFGVRMRRCIKAMPLVTVFHVFQAWSSSRRKPRTFRVRESHLQSDLCGNQGSKGSCREAATAATYTVGYLEESFESLWDWRIKIWLFCFRWQVSKPCSTKLRKFKCDMDAQINTTWNETCKSPKWQGPRWRRRRTDRTLSPLHLCQAETHQLLRRSVAEILQLKSENSSK